jgi:RsiW-degrading membrane proteinase PrsW (M82 family)
MNYPLFLFFGLAPSIVWLLFYLRKDSHPEPNWLIRKVFLWGMLITIPAIAVELTMKSLVSNIPLVQEMKVFLYFFLGVALVEELLKYFVVRVLVFHKPELDEPFDVMLYMIISALGFAALENIFLLSGLGPFSPVSNIAALAAVRLVGATLLHALASGLFGYFLARSLMDPKKRFRYFFIGLFCASLLHALFNFAILESEGIARILFPLALLAGLGITVSFCFERLKKLTF